MRDPRLDKLADVLVSYSAGVKKGDLVAIGADPIAFPGVRAVFERVLRAGGHPFWVPKSDALIESFFEHATDEQLAFVSPIAQHQVETVDVQIGFWADTNTRSLSRVDPKRQAAASAARKPIFRVFMDRAARGDLHWVGTQYPTPASAQDAEMSLDQYEDFVFRAGLLHLDDPAAAWTAIGERQQRLCDWLSTKKELRFVAEGTDLVVPVKGGTWINCCGRENFPDGEVFCGPQGADGTVAFSFPAVHNGREALGVRLTFKDGRVTDAHADKNEDFLHQMLEMDDGARTMGEIAVGTNFAITEFTRNTLFDEKIGGTFHMAVGAGYPESGNSNESGLHWDMVCDLRKGGRIEADGEAFLENGKFLKPEWPGNE